MTIPEKLALALALALFTGCGTESEPEKTLVITPAMRSSCPEHPFKPEFQGMAKQAAGGGLVSGYPLRVEIFNRDGILLTEWEGQYDPF